MADEKRLFDKPMSELREAFVRNRFGQTDVFGLAEIETWLQHQRTVERPDDLMWQSFLTRDFLAMCTATAPLAHLRERATRCHTQGGEDDGNYWTILSLCSDGLYWSYRGTGVYAPDSTKEMFVLTETNGELTFERISSSNAHVGARAVVYVLYEEWSRRHPKWHKARQFLCDALAEAIKRERANAEADFTTAVAVSADGTKIVHADWVVVFSAEDADRSFRKDLRFPASAFQQQKILRTRPPKDENGILISYTSPIDPDLWGSGVKRPIRTVQQLFESARDGDYPPPDGLGLPYARATFLARRDPSAQQLLLCTDGRVLLVHRNHCPSPLPDGGVAVTV